MEGGDHDMMDGAVEDKVDKVVLPGDLVGRITDLKMRLGPGLIQHQEHIVATKAGHLRNPTPKYFWVENVQRRYVPALEDMVIGVITDRHTENFKVDIGSAQLASLSMMAFEGATKKNKPNLHVGSVVYARVVLANKDMEPEIACLSSRNKAEGYGELADGYVFNTSISLAYRFLDENCAVLGLLGRNIPYEVAVGMNGRVWVKADTTKHCILVANALMHSEGLKDSQVATMLDRLENHFNTMH